MAEGATHRKIAAVTRGVEAAASHQRDIPILEDVRPQHQHPPQVDLRGGQASPRRDHLY